MMQVLKILTLTLITAVIWQGCMSQRMQYYEGEDHYSFQYKNYRLYASKVRVEPETQNEFLSLMKGNVVSVKDFVKALDSTIFKDTLKNTTDVDEHHPRMEYDCKMFNGKSFYLSLIKKETEELSGGKVIVKYSIQLCPSCVCPGPDMCFRLDILTEGNGKEYSVNKAVMKALVYEGMIL